MYLLYLQKVISRKTFFKQFFVSILKVNAENSRILRIRIRIYQSESWIRGSGSTIECHGSGTLALRLFKGLRRNSKMFSPSSNVVCLFIEIYWSVGEAILKQYWSVLNCNIEYGTPPIICIYRTFFHINRVESCNKDSLTEDHSKS